MSVVGGASTTGLVTRVQNIIMKPAAEWDVIAPEPATVAGLYTGYACILAAIPAIASILGTFLFLHWAILPIIVIAVLGYVAQLLGVFISAFVIDALAPSFGAQKNQIQALKLTVYSATPGVGRRHPHHRAGARPARYGSPSSTGSTSSTSACRS